jgi:oxygen-dependent protoporphyrinogen oxidase
MLGTIDPTRKKVIVVGAGISGLLAAYYLDREGYEVTLIESAPQSGGLISTATLEHGIAESAAHSLPASPAVRELFSDLGLELCPQRPEARARWIFRRGKFRRFPLGIFEILRTFFRAYFVLAPRRDPESLTLAEWAAHFLGKPALKYLLNPFVRGIYGASPDEILVSAAFPALCVPRGHSLISFFVAKKFRKNPPTAVTRELPKIPRGAISAPRLGMGSLTDALEKRLEQRLGARFVKNQRVDSLQEFENENSNIVLCTPARESARLLAHQAPRLSEMLARVRYSPLTTATVILKKSVLSRDPQGLGVLIPDGEGRNCLGVLFNSSAFPGRVVSDDLVSLTMMFGAAPLERPALDDLIRTELAALFGFKGGVVEISHRCWENAVPKYDAHLLETWSTAQASWCAKPGQLLFGNYTGQVSIRGMAELARGLNRTV